MPKLWKIKAWLFDKFGNLIWLAIIVGLVYLGYLFLPVILRSIGFLDSEMGM